MKVASEAWCQMGNFCSVGLRKTKRSRLVLTGFTMLVQIGMRWNHGAFISYQRILRDLIHGFAISI